MVKINSLPKYTDRNNSEKRDTHVTTNPHPTTPPPPPPGKSKNN